MFNNQYDVTDFKIWGLTKIITVYAFWEQNTFSSVKKMY